MSDAKLDYIIVHDKDDARGLYEVPVPTYTGNSIQLCAHPPGSSRTQCNKPKEMFNFGKRIEALEMYLLGDGHVSLHVWLDGRDVIYRHHDG